MGLAVDKEGYLLELDDWDEKVAHELASAEGIDLTHAHWELIWLAAKILRSLRRVPGNAATRETGRRTARQEKGNSIYLLEAVPRQPGEAARKDRRTAETNQLPLTAGHAHHQTIRCATTSPTTIVVGPLIPPLALCAARSTERARHHPLSRQRRLLNHGRGQARTRAMLDQAGENFFEPAQAHVDHHGLIAVSPVPASPGWCDWTLDVRSRSAPTGLRRGGSAECPRSWPSTRCGSDAGHRETLDAGFGQCLPALLHRGRR